MVLQANPYLIWQLLPLLCTLALGFYIQSRPRKRSVSGVLALIMFAGAFWSLTVVMQLASPDLAWQLLWDTLGFLAVVTIPTAWFFLAVKLTGTFQDRVERAKKWFFVVPVFSYLAFLTNEYHRLFFLSRAMVETDGFVILKWVSGPLFFFHTYYSYLLIILGVIILGINLIADRNKKYGTRGYALIIGVIAPLVGNIIHLRGMLPAGFPDPTPIAFTITGITFAWAIFADRMLEVVSFAHETVVADLVTGIIVLDSGDRIADINPAAAKIFDLSPSGVIDHPIQEILLHDREAWHTLHDALEQSGSGTQKFLIETGEIGKAYQVQISVVEDKHGRFKGRMLQFTDISRQQQAEKNLAATQETFASILDTFKDYYFETDVQGYIININLPLSQHLGYARKEDLIGKHFRHFTDRKSVRDVFTNFSRVFESKETIDLYRYTYRTRNGTTYIGETTLSPILEGDVTVGARGVLRNITDRVLAEEMLLQAKTDLDARVQELSAINRIAAISSRSLDLNTILETLCVELTSIFPVRNAGIALLSADRASLEVVAFHSADPAETSALGIRIPLEGNLASQEVINEQRTVVIQNSQEDSRTKSSADLFKARGTKAIMIVPLLTRGNAIGTIGMPAKDLEHVFTKEEIRLAETIASQIAAAIDNARLYQKTEMALDLVERDLEIGRQIQAGFFPESAPPIPGWEIATHYQAARQVSGDFYDYFPFGNSRMIGLVIADICDKGVGAALFMVLFRSLLRAFSRIDVDPQNVEGQLKNIIQNTSDYIVSIHGKSSMFATLFFGILDTETGRLYYINGGHEPPVVLDRQGRIIKRLPPTGPAIGLFSVVDYKVEQIVLNPGDFLVGFTDGTIDARNEKGESYSEERLLKYLQVPWTSMLSMVFELNNEFKNFEKGEPQFDDITLISLRRKLAPRIEKHAICRPAIPAFLEEIGDFVETAASYCKLSQDNVNAFRLAASEICTKVIQHGYHGRNSGVLSLFFEKEGKNARLIIRDDGDPLLPVQITVPEIGAAVEEGANHGQDRGSVNGLMDSIVYDRMQDDKGNQWVLERSVQTRSFA